MNRADVLKVVAENLSAIAAPKAGSTASELADWAFSTNRVETALRRLARIGFAVLGQQGAIRMEGGRMTQDGTDRLCRALYGRQARPRDAWRNWSEERMLHDAAERIEAQAEVIAAQTALLVAYRCGSKVKADAALTALAKAEERLARAKKEGGA